MLSDVTYMILKAFMTLFNCITVTIKRAHKKLTKISANADQFFCKINYFDQCFGGLLKT